MPERGCGVEPAPGNSMAAYSQFGGASNLNVKGGCFQVSRTAGNKRWTAGIVLLGVFATSLFYGDSMITPAVSVLSAVVYRRFVRRSM